MLSAMKVGSGLLGLAALAGLICSVQAETPSAQVPSLSLGKAIVAALEHNPDLAVIRKQRGIAQAGIIISRTYPFNPIWQTYAMATSGPASAGITNSLAIQQNFRLDLELRGQGGIRQNAAQAVLSRTEWEIANQELIVAVRTIRAFHTVVYRQDKNKLLEDAVRVQVEALKKIERLVNAGQLTQADLLVARGDLVEARAALGPSRALQVAASNELRRTLGVNGDVPPVHGDLEALAPEADLDGLESLARQRRPDLHALEMIVAEADQRVRLEIANRYGNPSLGPSWNYNETRVSFTGIWMIYQLPVLNTRQGDIMQRQAERDRAVADARRLKLQVEQDVQAARDRLREARKAVSYFAAESLPTLQAAADKLESLFAGGGVDVLRPIDAQRRLLRARDTYLDTLWELSQARADLALAVGDFSLVLGPPADAVPSRPTLLPPVDHVE
jgi:outer membrane protein TolC